ncbi:hypothetical protein JAO29_04290 [Edaphobacter sp. HDX4]|uniref:hypothetical protein n=1 Tax=Edaphobacter sp. HDX4 TaxID=2794064 RepID=UPI002FE595D4
MALADGSAQLAYGTALLSAGKYAVARTACQAALNAAATATAQSLEPGLSSAVTMVATRLQKESILCMARADESIHHGQSEAIDLALQEIERQRWSKDSERAVAMLDDLRKRYADDLYEKGGAAEQLNGKVRRAKTMPSWRNARDLIVESWWPALPFAMKFLAFVLIMFVLWASFRLFMLFGLRSTERQRRYKWRVWSVIDKTEQGAAGPIMEALDLGSNALLKRYFDHDGETYSILLSPFAAVRRDSEAPVEGDRKLRREESPRSASPDAAPPIWLNFLGPRGGPLTIESPPIASMKEHTFVLQEAVEELDFAIAGTEVKGIVGAARAVRRWLYKGLPATAAFAYRGGSDGAKDAVVRLTCVSGWGSSRTCSVIASTEEGAYTNALDLAAHRAAFKLFYRLAVPTMYADQVTAIAAFQQALLLMMLYI